MTEKPAMLDAIAATATDKPSKRHYLAPSRRGKRPWTIWIDPPTMRKLKAAAALSDRSLQKFGEEAAELLIERYYHP